MRIAMWALSGALVGIAGLSLPARAQSTSIEDDARCLSWGAQRGTHAYYECRATLDKERGGSAPAAVRPQEAEISDSMALSQCERQARQATRYPIERLASSFVFPGKEKRASLSFKVRKPGASVAFWNVDCKFTGGRMVDFRAPQ
jgi:hypothetical protein